jgi:23S rRNA (cytosine1962-C5)-methyltransferase
MKKLLLKKGREKALLRHHPWVFSGAVKDVEGDPLSGDTVAICGSDGHFLAWGAYSPTSQIRARVWSWNDGEVINPNFFQRKIQEAINLRKTWIPRENSTALRLVHAESDGLPGLIVDQYNGFLVVQILSAGIEAWREELLTVLNETCRPTGIVERSDVTVRELEGLPLRSGCVMGAPPEETITIIENGLKFNVDLLEGQKTGFYLDQRDNRQLCRQIAADKSVLNCFSYTGGFSVYALAGGANAVLAIDSSSEALEIAQDNIKANQLPEAHINWINGNVFEVLRQLRDQARSFDLVILDPPKFAPTASQAKKAARGYKDINLYGFKLLNPGGVLMTFSCSGGISADFFQKIVADAALDAGVEAKIIHRLSQAADHPTHMAFPEGTYLKGVVCQI